MRLSPQTAALVGYGGGLLFFALSFSWFGETAGALLGNLGFIVDLGPALIEAIAFALTAALASLAAGQLTTAWVPPVVAVGFTLTELLRSTGLLGAPLYQVGAAFVETPLAPLAAFGGVYAVTFVVALIGAELALVLGGQKLKRSAFWGFAGVALCTGAATGLATFVWPARTVEPATIRVAAVQGNIRQTVKWQPSSLQHAVNTYIDLTLPLKTFRPRFILWPETVITTDLQVDGSLAADPAYAEINAQGRQLRARFGRLAQSLGTIIAVGSLESTASAPYNALFFFGETGTVSVYRKRRLVPFAEFLPGPLALRQLPYASLVSRFGAGSTFTPIDVGLRVAPMICWEADFTDLAQQQAAAGAQFFAIATDDAWFGDSDGPYAQAQLAQLRAIETGRWIVRAAATGISGIIGPDGRWRERSALDTAVTITGTIGKPQPTFYSRIGPWPVGMALTLLGLVAGLAGYRRTCIPR